MRSRPPKPSVRDRQNRAFETAKTERSRPPKPSVRDRQNRAGAGSQRDPLLAWLASACLAGDAGLRPDGRGAPPRTSAAAPKNEGQGSPIPTLIGWSVQEIRRVAMRLAQRRIRPAHVIAWSVWRRAHQAAARDAHIRTRPQL